MDPQRAGFYRVSRCADDGNRLGIEDRLKFVKLFLKQSRSSGRPDMSGRIPVQLPVLAIAISQPLLQDNAGINRHCLIGIGEYGIEVKLLYLRILLHKLRYLDY